MRVQLNEPDNEITVETFRKLQDKCPFTESCVSLKCHTEETKRAVSFLDTIDFGDVPSSIQKDRKNIMLLMEGCCRNYPTLIKKFPGYRVIAIDSS